MSDRLASALWMPSLYLFVPILIANVPMGATWRSIAVAYGLWLGGLFLAGLMASRSLGKAIGWPMIFGMFLTIPAIPLIVYLLKLKGVRCPVPVQSSR